MQSVLCHWCLRTSIPDKTTACLLPDVVEPNRDSGVQTSVQIACLNKMFFNPLSILAGHTSCHLLMQGLGEELALYFAAHGAKLILSSRKEHQLQRVKGRCVGKHAPEGIKILPFDLVGGKEEMQQAVAQAVASFPGVPLSYLVLNAGMEAGHTDWGYS